MGVVRQLTAALCGLVLSPIHARGVLGEVAVTDVMRTVFDYLTGWMALASSLADGLGMQTRFDTLSLREAC
jgi:hypothetical protein